MKAQIANQPINLFVLGDPTSGKSTHGAMLARKYRLVVCDVGQELHRLRQTNKSLDAVLKRTIDRGHLAPTRIVRRILRLVVEQLPSDKGILFGGNPKMVGEARFLHQLFKKRGRTNSVLLYLTIPRKIIAQRTKRRPGYAGKTKRADDTPQALQARLAFWKKDIATVVKYWRQRVPFIQVSSHGPTAVVHRRIETKLKPYLNR
jgi:adenylate kinase family enzyme